MISHCASVKSLVFLFSLFYHFFFMWTSSYSEEKTYEYGEEEFNDKIKNITYTSDTVRTSYIPRKDIIECGFWHDDVRVYLTFVSTDISDFSENFSNEALTDVKQPDAECAEKFEEIFKMIFGINFDRAAIQDPYYGILRGIRYEKINMLLLMFFIIISK